MLRAGTVAELRDALAEARETDGVTVVHIDVDPLADAPDGGSWWDVPVAETSSLESVRAARAHYVDGKRAQRDHL